MKKDKKENSFSKKIDYINNKLKDWKEELESIKKKIKS